MRPASRNCSPWRRITVASLLSGGLDSSLIAAIAARAQRDRGQTLGTYTIDYAEAGEVEYSAKQMHVDRDTPHAEDVARHIGSRHTTHYVSLADLIGAHEKSLTAMDLPSFSPINVSLLLLFQRIRRDAIVVLSGESADELFGGYRYLLHRKDRMSMATGVEARVPFCDHRLVEYVWSIPWDMKNVGGMEKGILRKAVEDLLPRSVAWRSKSGYPAALTGGYQAYLWARMRDLTADINAPLWQFVDRFAVAASLAEECDLTNWTAVMRVAYLLEVDSWLTHYRVRAR
jgi:asparagine synthetase B (glutamine-hydrolysing)